MLGRLVLLALVLAAPLATADTQLCRPVDVDVVILACEAKPDPNGGTNDTTELRLVVSTDAPLAPSFVLRVRFEEQGWGDGSGSRCSIDYYELDDDPGPQRIGWGTGTCIYPFHVEEP